jgi:MPBQ/MSBQ methyltransferase
LNEDIQKHYAWPNLADAILDALENAGKDLNRLTPDDLAPIDEFHIRGRKATLELARAAKIDAGKHVLDVGSGLGGTARFLAHQSHQYGCQVTGIDLITARRRQ